jgi:hypothetical protein
MGQVTSNPLPSPAITDFINLPKEAILSLWLSYNLLGEGWGLGKEQFLSLFEEAEYIRKNYNFSEEKLTALFNSFDTDQNGLIDALEAIVAIGLLSGIVVSYRILSFSHYVVVRHGCCRENLFRF